MFPFSGVARSRPQKKKVLPPCIPSSSRFFSSTTHSSPRLRRESGDKGGADLFDTPDRPSLVELTLFANERGSGAFENPDVVVGRLFADDGGDHSGQAAEFNVENIVNGLARGASHAKGHFTGGFYGDADQPRLCGWRDKGQLGLRGRRPEIQ